MKPELVSQVTLAPSSYPGSLHSPSQSSLVTYGCQRWDERGQVAGGGACLTGPALSPGSRAAQHSGRSPLAALLWELPEKEMSGKSAGTDTRGDEGGQVGSSGLGAEFE